MDINNENQPTKHDESSEDNLVHDLKKSLKGVIDETTAILDGLEQTVETTIKDQSISDATKKIVDSVKSDIKNSVVEKSKETINTIETKKAINNFEEE
jgi:peptide subunit release factor 1 (eRF1)